MNDTHPISGPFWRGLSPREQLNLAIEDPGYAKIIARYFIGISLHSDCIDALQHLVEMQDVLGQEMHQYVTRLAELERERVKFLDPNHPGE